MKRNYHQFSYSAARAVAVTALIAIMAFASAPVLAAKASAQQRVDRVEARITDMHAKLKITQAQEDQWAKVAQVMRDNEKAIEPLIKTRAENAKTMTAIDDLKSYAAVADAHADGLRKFTPVFEALYAGMSDDQKKEADFLFRHGDKKSKKHK